MSVVLQLGDTAPAWRGVAVGGNYGTGTEVSSEDFARRLLVLYFYPKDGTPGCAEQACSLRDRWEHFHRLNAVIFGVSVDPVESHRKFIAENTLPFPLVSDTSQAMVKAFGVWVEKTMYGKTFWGTERTTFVVRPDGRIKSIFRRVKPADHSSLLEEDLANFVP